MYWQTRRQGGKVLCKCSHLLLLLLLLLECTGCLLEQRECIITMLIGRQMSWQQPHAHVPLTPDKQAAHLKCMLLCSWH